MLKTNYHTHMKYCNHADGMVIDYVKKAKDLGFIELGMSDHAPILKEWMKNEEYQDNWGSDSMTLEQIEDYLNQIKECQRLFPEIKIYSGFETEYLYDLKDFYKFLYDKVDYLNLGLHFLRSKTGDVLNCYTELNYKNLDEYLLAAEEALSTGMYTTFVHPDMFMFGYKDKNGEWTFDAECERVTRRIAELAIKYDVYLEVNCNGLKYCKNKHDRSTWLYPYPKFWEIIKEYPVKILIGCDAHTPDALGNLNVKLVCDFAMELGLDISEKMVIR